MGAGVKGWSKVGTTAVAEGAGGGRVEGWGVRGRRRPFTCWIMRCAEAASRGVWCAYLLGAHKVESLCDLELGGKSLLRLGAQSVHTHDTVRGAPVGERVEIVGDRAPGHAAPPQPN